MKLCTARSSFMQSNVGCGRPGEVLSPVERFLCRRVAGPMLQGLGSPTFRFAPPGARGRAKMPTLRESGDMNLISRIAALQDKTSFKELHWEGSLEEYLKIVRENPRVTRTAFQRIYDMILSHGKTEYIDYKKRLIRYPFFHDEPNGGRDAVYGLDVPLMKLVNVFKSAAQGYGTEKRVILLHGPVGSSKSTIVRLLKKGLEEYSRTPEGALYTFSWVLEKKREDGSTHREVFNSPMNEDPLLLIPEDWREKVFLDLASPDAGFQVPVRGD